MKTSRMALVLGFMLTTIGGSALANELLVDSDFDDGPDSVGLRANSAGQDWYESRQDVPTLLTLDLTNVGGNATKKAKLTASTVGNAYLTQEFSAPQTQQFAAQWDIYVDSILDRPDSIYDRAAWVFIGDDTGTTPDRVGPNAEDSERFVYLGFYKAGGGTSETMDLVARESSVTATTFTTVATGLSLKRWYTIRVCCDLAQDTYEVYIDGQLQGMVKARTPKDSVTHISFAEWPQDEGAGTFYVDNVTASGGVVALEPQPLSGAIGVTVKAPPLQWRPAGTAIRQLVFFGREADLVAATDASVLAGTTDRAVFPITSTLDLNTTYYWSVATVTTENEVIPGPVWSFTTSDSEPELADVTRPWDVIKGFPDNAHWLPDSGPLQAIDNQVELYYWHLDAPATVGPVGFAVAPFVGPTIVTELTFTTTNVPDPRLDPVSFELYGSNVSIDGRYNLIASGDIDDFAQPAPWPRLSQNKTPIKFQNDVAYEYYQLLFPTVRGQAYSSFNSIHITQEDEGMRIGEVELKGVPVCLAGPCDAYLVGTVRNILTGARITNAGQTSVGTATRGPCRGSGSEAFPVYPDYWVEVVEGRCYKVTVDVNDFQEEGPIDVQLVADGHTIRDFALWPESVSLPPSRPVYRFRSPVMPYSYYFTPHESEKNDLLFDDPNRTDTCVEWRDPNNWTYDGIAFCGLEDESDPDLAVYRFRHAETGIRAYAFGIGGPVGLPGNWEPHAESDEIAFYAYRPDGEQPDGTCAVYRVWSDSLQCYAYISEDDVSRFSGEGWVIDTENDLAWYALKRPEQQVP